MTDSSQLPGTRGVEELIVARVADRAEQWFPDLGASPTLRLRTLSDRPRCALFVVSLSDGATTRQVVAKTRRGNSGGSVDPRALRPTLAPEPAAAAELTALEFDGLRTIAEFVGASHPDFGFLRPLDHMESESTILMDYVDARTLRQECIAQSRLMITGRSVSRRAGSDRSWRNAGAWLRAYHQAPGHLVTGHAKPARQSTRGEVTDRFCAYGDFLTDRIGARFTRDVAARGAAVAGDALPPELALVVGHGDYVMRNMFVDTHDRITVFDPMPRWRMPYLEDVCRFLVGLRLLGLQLRSHGAAYSSRELDRIEGLFLSGYFADDEPPMRQIRCYQLLILLDKWSALVGPPTRRIGAASRLRTAFMWPANEYIGREARRLVELCEGLPASPEEGSP